jgi:hypothetical protein
MYETYATAALSPQDRFVLALDPIEIQRTLAHRMNNLALDMMAGTEELLALINLIGEQGPVAAKELPAVGSATLLRTLGWLIKMGIVKRT